jgi:hypothetical protein
MNRLPFWKRPLIMLLLVVLTIAGGAWLALDRPMPEGWSGENGKPDLRLPEFIRREPAERIFCAESTETGICRCITSSGERPDIEQDECRRRARESATELDP